MIFIRAYAPTFLAVATPFVVVALLAVLFGCTSCAPPVDTGDSADCTETKGNPNEFTCTGEWVHNDQDGWICVECP